MKPPHILARADCLAWMSSFNNSEGTYGNITLVVGSPPYPGKAARYIVNNRSKKVGVDHEDWTQWMLNVIEASLKIAPVCALVVNDFYRDGQFHPVIAGLQWLAYINNCHAERPLIWHKNAPPSRKDWFGNDWEHILVFKRECGPVPTFNWEAIAEPPKFKTGGRFRQRSTTGERRLGSSYPQGKLARPRDVLRVTVGGGHLGSKLAHQCEAPYPEKLVEPLILALTNPGETVLDPFVGSGTTCAVAARLGRGYIGIDNRQSQIDLTKQRLGWPVTTAKITAKQRS